MRRYGERGQALVEFAIAASLTLFLIFGIVEFGRALFAKDLVAHVARVGARYAIVNSGACTVSKANCQNAIVAAIKAKMSTGDAANLTPAPVITWEQVSGADCYVAGCYVSVTVSYAFSFVTLPFPAQTFTSHSQMEIAQ